jgi:hypothetical protein
MVVECDIPAGMTIDQYRSRRTKTDARRAKARAGILGHLAQRFSR